jgi:hypothetical protein
MAFLLLAIFSMQAPGDGWALSTLIHNYTHIRTPIHPIWPRCSSFKYPDIIHSSRLAGWAPRRSRCMTVIMNQGT